MRSLLLFLSVLCASAPLAAQDRYVTRVTWVEEWVEVEGAADGHAYGQPEATLPQEAQTADRALAFRRSNIPTAIAAFGPFRVLGPRRAALVGVTGLHSPAQFAAMLRAFPDIATLELIECPGTEDDRANLALGRMIRAHGLATHVPRGGSVRSGAVELLLAGVRREVEDGAQFAVHSWRDDSGLEPTDYAPTAPENRAYLQYYTDMGMDEGAARAFYDLTNSVPYDGALWLDARAMRPWLAAMGSAGTGDAPTVDVSPAAPRIAYLDLNHSGL